MRGRLGSPENWDCMLEIFGTCFGQSQTDLGLKRDPKCFTFVLNCGLGVVRPEMAMGSRFHKVEPMLGERAAHGQSTAWFGTIKNSLNLRVGPKTSM